MTTFDRVVVQGAVEQMYPVNMGIYELFWGGKDEDPVDTEYVEVAIYKGSRRHAKYTKRGSRGHQVENVGYKDVAYKPPLMKPTKTTRASELFKKDFGKTPFDNGTSGADRAYAKLGKDFEELKEMCERTKLLQASEALESGTVTIDENGATRTIDFDMPSSHKIVLSGTDLWTDTTNSDPIADIMAWQVMIAKDSGLQLDALVFGIDVVAAFIAHPKVQSYFDKRNIVIGDVKVEKLDNGLTRISDVMGTDIYTFIEWVKDNDTGLDTPVVPDNMVLGGSVKAKVSTHYAAVEVVEDDIVYPAAMREYTDVYTDRSAGAMKAEYQTAPLVALSQADAFMSAVVA